MFNIVLSSPLISPKQMERERAIKKVKNRERGGERERGRERERERERNEESMSF